MSKIYGKTYYDLVLAETSQEEIDQYLEKFNIDKQDDMMYVAFKGMPFDQPNSNRDGVYWEDAKERLGTLPHKPIDVEHGTAKEMSIMNPYRDRVIGTILGGEKASQETEEGMKDYLLVLGGIWKNKFPVEAQKMKEDFESKNLTFSMEIAFGEMTCSECGETFSAKDAHVCEHLLNHRKAESSTIRWAKDIIFSAFSVVTTPAWEDAHAIALGSEEDVDIAKQINELKELLGGMMSDTKKTYSDAEIEAIKEAAVKAALEKLQQEKIELEEALREKDEALSTLETDYTKQLEEKEGAINDLTAERDKISTEFDDFKKAQEKKEFLAERFKKLEEAQFEITDENKHIFEKQMLALEDEEFELWLETFAKKSDDNDTIEASKKDAITGTRKDDKSAKAELDEIFKEDE